LQSVPHGEPAAKKDTAPIIEVTDLHCKFSMKAGFFGKAKQTITAVDHVTLNIKEGFTYGIVGESGSGKSTLGLSILQLVKSSGLVTYAGNNLHSLKAGSLRKLRREIQIVFQDPFSSLSPRLTIGQIINEGLQIHFPRLNKEEALLKVNTILREVGLEEEMARRYPHEFSGGQRQRIAIARAMVLEPKFVVLDEPTSALDMTIQAQIIDLLRKFQEKLGITYLFISHDLKVVRALADEIAVMKDGKIVEAGPAAAIFANPTHPYTRQLFRAAFDLAAA
jgi:microcin C transport system ATP-binding protein